jgi:GntR family transcriptional regulator, transcriptional repressor for pyruvate dehydrogenase complex
MRHVSSDETPGTNGSVGRSASGSVRGDEWHPVRRVRTHEHVLAQIADRILDGRLEVGDRLPSERELVAALGVSRGSVREALRILESMGIIEANVGSGRDAGSTVSGRPSEALSNLLRLHMALSRFQLVDLVEVRIQLERAAAARAALVAEPSDITRLNEIVDEMSRGDLEHARFHELDTEFHVTIAHVSGNALSADLMQALRGAVRVHMETAFEAIDDWDGMVRSLSEEHRQIAAAIDAHDGSRAADLVAEHIAHFYDATSDVNVDWKLAAKGEAHRL